MSKRRSAIRVKTRHRDVDGFVQGYRALFEHSALFVRTREAREVGTRLRFEFRLATDEIVFRGEGVIVEVVDSESDRPGLRVRFSKLDRKSMALLAEVRRQTSSGPSGLRVAGQGDGVESPQPQQSASSPLSSPSSPRLVGSSQRLGLSGDDLDEIANAFDEGLAGMLGGSTADGQAASAVDTADDEPPVQPEGSQPGHAVLGRVVLQRTTREAAAAGPDPISRPTEPPQRPADPGSDTWGAGPATLRDVEESPDTPQFAHQAELLTFETDLESDPPSLVTVDTTVLDRLLSPDGRDPDGDDARLPSERLLSAFDEDWEATPSDDEGLSHALSAENGTKTELGPSSLAELTPAMGLRNTELEAFEADLLANPETGVELQLASDSDLGLHDSDSVWLGGDPDQVGESPFKMPEWMPMDHPTPAVSSDDPAHEFELDGDLPTPQTDELLGNLSLAKASMQPSEGLPTASEVSQYDDSALPELDDDLSLPSLPDVFGQLPEELEFPAPLAPGVFEVGSEEDLEQPNGYFGVDGQVERGIMAESLPQTGGAYSGGAEYVDRVSRVFEGQEGPSGDPASAGPSNVGPSVFSNPIDADLSVADPTAAGSGSPEALQRVAQASVTKRTPAKRRGPLSKTEEAERERRRRVFGKKRRKKR